MIQAVLRHLTTNDLVYDQMKYFVQHWKTKIYRTDNLRPGPFSIRPWIFKFDQTFENILKERRQF